MRHSLVYGPHRQIDFDSILHLTLVDHPSPFWLANSHLGHDGQAGLIVGVHTGILTRDYCRTLHNGGRLLAMYQTCKRMILAWES